MLGNIILFLLFMGAEKLVNRFAGRPVMNGANWYLVVMAILFAVGVSRLSGMELTASQHAQMLGTLVGQLVLPVGVAIYYSRKFSNEKKAAALAES